MTLALMLVAAIGAVVLTERGAEHLPFAMAALFLNAALLLIFVADIERAVLLSGLLAIAIAAASIVKFKHSALKLSVADVPLMFPGTLPFFASQYPRVTSAVLAGAVFFVSASSAVLFYAAGSPLSVAFRILLVSLALIGVVVASAAKDSAASVRGSLTEPRCFYSTFMALTKMQNFVRLWDGRAARSDYLKLQASRASGNLTWYVPHFCRMATPCRAPLKWVSVQQ